MLPLAILCGSLREGVDHVLGLGEDLHAFNRTSMRGEMTVLGVRRPFVIINDGNQLRGLHIMGWVVVGRPAWHVTQVAPTRVKE